MSEEGSEPYKKWLDKISDGRCKERGIELKGQLKRENSPTYALSGLVQRVQIPFTRDT